MSAFLATFDRTAPASLGDAETEVAAYGLRISFSGTTAGTFATRHGYWTAAGGDADRFARWIAGTYVRDVSAQDAFGLGYVADTLPDILPHGGEEPGGETRITDDILRFGDRLSLAIANQYQLGYPVFLDTHYYWLGDHTQEEGEPAPRYAAKVDSQLAACASLLTLAGGAVYVNAGNAGGYSRIVRLLNSPKVAGGVIQRVLIDNPNESDGWAKMAYVFDNVHSSRVVAFEVLLPFGWTAGQLTTALTMFRDRRVRENQYVIVRELLVDETEADVSLATVLASWAAL